MFGYLAALAAAVDAGGGAGALETGRGAVGRRGEAQWGAEMLK